MENNEKTENAERHSKQIGNITLCRNCGKQLESGIKFCSSCGTASEEELPKQAEELRNHSVQNSKRKTPRKTSPLVWLIVILLITAVITNPREERHRQAVLSNLSRNHDISGMGLLGLSLGAQFSVEVDNYVFLSFTRLRGNSAWVGVGAFGNVWIFGNITFGEQRQRIF